MWNYKLQVDTLRFLFSWLYWIISLFHLMLEHLFACKHAKGSQSEGDLPWWLQKPLWRPLELSSYRLSSKQVSPKSHSHKQWSYHLSSHKQVNLQRSQDLWSAHISSHKQVSPKSSSQELWCYHRSWQTRKPLARTMILSPGLTN